MRRFEAVTGNRFVVLFGPLHFWKVYDGLSFFFIVFIVFVSLLSFPFFSLFLVQIVFLKLPIIIFYFLLLLFF